MAPPKPDIDPFVEDIRERILEDRMTLQQVIDWLRLEHGVTTSRSFLTTRLKAWNISTKPRLHPETGELRAAIASHFYQTILTDEMTSAMLNLDGYKMSPHKLKRLRAKMGLVKRLPPWQTAEVDAMMKEVLIKEFSEGRIEDFGYRQLYLNMRSKYRDFHMVGRNRLYRIARPLNPEGFQRRLHRRLSRRGHVLTPGPNYVWSMDAHCKLEFWGIQIYAAIDQYSRCIMWYYVGITSRTAVSVLAQYLGKVAADGVMPRYVRSDRGAETTMAADAHFQLSRLVRQYYGEEDPEFDHCYRFGTSKQNQRIESWWAQMTKACLSRWRHFFEQLSRAHHFEQGAMADRIALLAIYIPIIRNELVEFVIGWNNHVIRGQTDREYIVPGIPSVLYNYPGLSKVPATEQGYQVPEELLQPFLDDIEGANIEEYLPQETLDWCARTLQETFPGATIDGGTSDIHGNKLHYQAYMHLRARITEHQFNEWPPNLCETIRPYGARDWRPAPDVAHAFQAPVGDPTAPAPVGGRVNNEHDQWLVNALHEGLQIGAV